MSTSQPKSTTLNPSATEFVPSFVLQQNANPTSNGTSNGGAYVNNGGHYNNNHRNQHYYNNNNNYHNNNRSNGHQQQYRNHNNNNSYYNNNYSNNYNPNDVDPIEIEARCEAVIEILQDDNIRDQLNPSSPWNRLHLHHHIKQARTVTIITMTVKSHHATMKKKCSK